MQMLAAEIPSWVVSVTAFMFGAAWGSFFNVAIYRWPRDMSVVRPPSHCPRCGARIPARWNIPLFGYLLLRGRAACCGATLSPRYPIVELLSAVLCVAVAHRHIVHAPAGSELLVAVLITVCYFAFAGGLLIAAFTDLEGMEIPDEVSLPGAALGLATVTLRDPEGVAAAALGAGGGFLFIQLIFVWGYEALTGRRGMGEGDSKLLMMIGAFVGWQGAAFALSAGAAQGLLAWAYLRLTGQQIGPRVVYTGGDDDELEDDSAGEDGDEADEDAEPYDEEVIELSEPPPERLGHERIPFGPFLSLAALEYLFFGPALVDLWFSLVARATDFL